MIPVLKELSQAHRPVNELFRRMDVSGLGRVEIKEFARALRALNIGKGCNNDTLHAVFRRIDSDGSGSISYQELSNAVHNLLKGVELRGAVKIQTSFRGSQGRKRANEIRAREEAQTHQGALRALSELRAKLAAQLDQMQKVFQTWDDDQSGRVSRREFRQGVALLGIDADREALDAMFDLLDADGSGALEYRELHRRLNAPELHRGASSLYLHTRGTRSSSSSAEGRAQMVTSPRPLETERLAAEEDIAARIREHAEASMAAEDVARARAAEKEATARAAEEAGKAVAAQAAAAEADAAARRERARREAMEDELNQLRRRSEGQVADAIREAAEERALREATEGRCEELDRLCHALRWRCTEAERACAAAEAAAEALARSCEYKAASDEAAYSSMTDRAEAALVRTAGELATVAREASAAHEAYQAEAAQAASDAAAANAAVKEAARGAIEKMDQQRLASERALLEAQTQTAEALKAATAAQLAVDAAQRSEAVMREALATAERQRDEAMEATEAMMRHAAAEREQFEQRAWQMVEEAEAKLQSAEEEAALARAAESLTAATLDAERAASEEAGRRAEVIAAEVKRATEVADEANEARKAAEAAIAQAEEATEGARLQAAEERARRETAEHRCEELERRCTEQASNARRVESEGAEERERAALEAVKEKQKAVKAAINKAEEDRQQSIVQASEVQNRLREELAAKEHELRKWRSGQITRGPPLNAEWEADNGRKGGRHEVHMGERRLATSTSLDANRRLTGATTTSDATRLRERPTSPARSPSRTLQFSAAPYSSSHASCHASSLHGSCNGSSPTRSSIPPSRNAPVGVLARVDEAYDALPAAIRWAPAAKPCSSSSCTSANPSGQHFREQSTAADLVWEPWSEVSAMESIRVTDTRVALEALFPSKNEFYRLADEMMGAPSGRSLHAVHSVGAAG